MEVWNVLQWWQFEWWRHRLEISFDGMKHRPTRIFVPSLSCTGWMESFVRGQLSTNYSVVWHSMVLHSVVGHFIKLFNGMAWYGMVWNGAVPYGVVCYGMVRYGNSCTKIFNGNPNNPSVSPFPNMPPPPPPPPSLLCKLFVSKVRSWIIHSLFPQLIHPKKWISLLENSAENSNFTLKDCLRTRKLSIL